MKITNDPRTGRAEFTLSREELVLVFRTGEDAAHALPDNRLSALEDLIGRLAQEAFNQSKQQEYPEEYPVCFNLDYSSTAHRCQGAKDLAPCGHKEECCRLTEQADKDREKEPDCFGLSCDLNDPACASQCELTAQCHEACHGP